MSNKMNKDDLGKELIRWVDLKPQKIDWAWRSKEGVERLIAQEEQHFSNSHFIYAEIATILYNSETEKAFKQEFEERIKFGKERENIWGKSDSERRVNMLRRQNNDHAVCLKVLGLRVSEKVLPIVAGAECGECNFYMKEVDYRGKGWCIGVLKNSPEEAPNDEISICFISSSERSQYVLTPREASELSDSLRFIIGKNEWTRSMMKKGKK